MMTNRIIRSRRAFCGACAKTKAVVSRLQNNRHKRFRPPKQNRRMQVRHIKDRTGECQRLQQMTAVFDPYRTNSRIIWCEKADYCKHVGMIDCKIMFYGDMTARVNLKVL